MPRRISVELLGDASQLQRTFNRAGSSAKSFNREIGKASRGTIAGSGLLKGVGRSIAFASGGFLAFSGISEFLRHSIDAAVEANVTQRQLAAQFKASGQELGKYQGAIDKTNLKLSALSGFTKDELDQSFITLFRSTNDATRALDLNAVAADLARGRHMDLGKAALLIAKVVNGNVGLLKRYGIEVTKGETATQALAAVQQKYAGQARAGSTAQQRFGAVLHDTEVIIGTALLPTLTRLLNHASQWLTRANETGRIQRDVNQAMRVGTQVIHGVEDGLHVVTAVLRPVNRLLGGTRHSMQLLTLAFVAFKLRGVVSLVQGVGTAVKALAKLTLAEEAANARLPGTKLPGQKKLPGMAKEAGAVKVVKNIAKYGGPVAIGAGAALPIVIGVTAPKSATYGAPQQYSTDGKGHFFRIVPTRAGGPRKVSVSAKEYQEATGKSAIVIHHVDVHGVRNVDQLASQLEKKAKRKPRRGQR